MQIKKIFLFSFVSMLISSTCFSYGAIKVNRQGAPLKWTQFPITYNLDSGPAKGAAICNDPANPSNNGNDSTPSAGSGGGCSLSPILMAMIQSHQEGAQAVSDSFNLWKNAGSSLLSFREGANLDDSGDVNVCNFQDFIILSDLKPDDPKICGNLGTCNTPATNPIIFDSDGGITDYIFGLGASNRVLGFAGPVEVENVNFIPKLQAVFNMKCAAPADKGCNGTEYSDNEVRSVMIHELGHALGLDHSEVANASMYTSTSSGLVANPGFEDAIPTMFPILVEGATMSSLHADDVQSILHLYGTNSSPSSTTCSVEGDIQCVGCSIAFSNLGGKGNFVVNSGAQNIPLSCVEIVAKSNDPTQSLAVLSGAEVENDPAQYASTAGSVDYDGPDDCLKGPNPSRCGHFKIDGLKAGQSYTLQIQEVNPAFRRGSSINPCVYPLINYSSSFTQNISCTANQVHSAGTVNVVPGKP